MLVLNVGGGSRDLPPRYAGWEQHLLDINPATGPDFCCSALDIDTNTALHGKYDAVYASHCLEHVYKHEVGAVLRGFLSALNDDGFADVIVPNIPFMLAQMRERELDLDDVWYRVDGTAVTFHDTLYGWNQAMERGNLFYAHRCGFTSISLMEAAAKAGFGSVYTAAVGPNLFLQAYKQEGRGAKWSL